MVPGSCHAIDWHPPTGATTSIARHAEVEAARKICRDLGNAVPPTGRIYFSRYSCKNSTVA
jgi:tRNA(Arg) A34 adenosine deaminase TadA